MEIHAALCKPGQRATPVLREVDHRQIRATSEREAGFLPPSIGPSSTVGIDHDLCGATAGLSYQFLIGLTYLNPEIDRPRQIFLPQRRLVLRADAAAECEGVVCVQRKGQQSHHHAFIGLRRMASQRDGMVFIVLPIHVGDMQRGFEDGGIGGHGVVVLSREGVSAERQGRLI